MTGKDDHHDDGDGDSGGDGDGDDSVMTNIGA